MSAVRRRRVAALLLVLCCCCAPSRDEEALSVARDVRSDVRPVERLTGRDLLGLLNAGEMVGDGLSLSPDGSRFAFEAHRADLDRNTYRVAWFIGSVSGEGPVVNVGDGGDAALFRNAQGAWSAFPAVWSPEGRWIIYRRRVQGQTQIWRSRIDGARREQLTNSAADVTAFAATPDGEALLFETDASRATLARAAEAEARDGYRVDDQHFNPFYEPAPLYPPYRLTGGRPALWRQPISGVPRQATSADAATWLRLRNGPALEARPRALQVRLAEGRWRVSWLENRNPERNRGLAPPLTLFASRQADGSGAAACSAPLCTGRLVNLGASRADEIVFVRAEKGRYRLLAWHPETNRLREIFRTDDWLSSCNLASLAAVCFVESPVRPRRVVSIGLADGALRTLAEPNPEFGRFKLGSAERLDWRNRYGSEAWGYLVKPAEFAPGRRYPLVITSYSAPACLRGNTGDEFPTHLFSARGLIVLCFSEFAVNTELMAREPDPMKIFVADYEDFARQKELLAALEAAIDLLDRRGLIDRRRVGLAGLSAGAEMVQYALVQSNAFAAAAAPTLAFNPIAYFGATKKARDALQRPIGMGDPLKVEEAYGWREIATSLHIERINTPLLIQAADREYLYAMPTAVRAFDARKPFEMFVYPDEHHVKFQPAHRLRVYERYVDWFDFWLNGHEDPDSAKAEQYARWREMRARRATQPVR